MDQRRVIARTADGWEGVEHEGYVPGVPTNVVRHTLIGARKDDTSDPGPTNELRYFELPAGSVTRLEKHEHEHYVIVGHGVGHAIVGDAVREVRPRDVVYVGPFEPHQFVNRGSDSFGFFCLVSSVRDFSQELDPAELARLLASPAGAYADPNGAPPPRRRAALV
ncbi:MAG: cupin domain-containing protein [Candidatus Eremiobacteraeota bacterium]|nr:cupin domain-containing protein [Candidatus Eremiobacteraeota bacterium]